MPRGIEHRAVVRSRQMRCEEADRRQRECTLGKPIENDGEPPSSAGRFDASIGRVLGQVQHLHAVREQ